MKKGQVIEGIVTKVQFPNKGIVEAEGERIEVKGVLPGQKVSAAVQKVRHGKAEGRCIAVLERAPYEIAAQCPHAGECGGCSYQTMPYEEQLKLKEQQVLALMRPVFERQERLTAAEGSVEESSESVGKAGGFQDKFAGGEEGTDCKRGEAVSGEEGADCRLDEAAGGEEGADCRRNGAVSGEGGANCGRGEAAGGEEGTDCKRNGAVSGEEGANCGRGEADSGEYGADCGRDELKVNIAGGDLKHFVFEGIRKSPLRFGYRNKMEFTFGDEYKDGPLSLGMHKKGSFYDIVPVTECCIVDEDYRKILRTVMEYAQEKKLSFYHRLRHEGYLRHLLVRKAARTGELLIAIVTTTQEEHGQELKELCGQLLALSIDGKIVGIVHTYNDSLADVVQSDTTEILHGQDHFYEELLGLRFRISEFSFFQTNSLGAEVLYETAREYIGEIRTKNGKKPVIYDLYSGTGTIAQMMAPVAYQVIGVEIVEEAVHAARENAALNGLQNCKFIAGDVLKVLDEIEEQPDFIILDPPRDGIHPKALKKIIAYGVERLVYISCKPTSLARDLEVFLDNGYRIERMCCVDMFPGTVHVETVTLLSHKAPDSTVDITVEFGEGEGKVPSDNIDRRTEAYKPKEKVTYEMIQEYVEDKYGFKVHTAYIAEVKRGLSLPMYDAPNAVEELKQPRKHPTAEKVEAIKEALRYYEVI